MLSSENTIITPIYKILISWIHVSLLVIYIIFSIMKFQKIIIYLALVLDIIGISVMIPAFPELKAYYGISDFAVTMGLTVYSLFAFLAAPVL